MKSEDEIVGHIRDEENHNEQGVISAVTKWIQSCKRIPTEHHPTSKYSSLKPPLKYTDKLPPPISGD